MQGALLRVIDSGEVMRLGGSRVIPVDVRVIISASVNLERHVENAEVVKGWLQRKRGGKVED